MPNPLFQSIMSGGMMPMQMPQMHPIQNLIQQAGMIYQSMQNPRAFVGQYLPFIPENIRNNPDQIMNYMQQTGRITPQQVAFLNQIPRPGM